MFLLWLLELSVSAQMMAGAAHAADAMAVPIKLTSPFNLVVLKVEVNGHAAVFVVDTGCSNTILSTRLTGMNPDAPQPGSQPLKGSGLVGRAARVQATLKIGTAVWPHHEFLAMDDLSDISRALKHKVDGVLGQDILGQFKQVEIDFNHRRLVFSR